MEKRLPKCFDFSLGFEYVIPVFRCGFSMLIRALCGVLFWVVFFMGEYHCVSIHSVCVFYFFVLFSFSP